MWIKALWTCFQNIFIYSKLYVISFFAKNVHHLPLKIRFSNEFSQNYSQESLASDFFVSQWKFEACVICIKTKAQLVNQLQAIAMAYQSTPLIIIIIRFHSTILKLLGLQYLLALHSSNQTLKHKGHCWIYYTKTHQLALPCFGIPTKRWFLVNVLTRMQIYSWT